MLTCLGEPNIFNYKIGQRGQECKPFHAGNVSNTLPSIQVLLDHIKEKTKWNSIRSPGHNDIHPRVLKKLKDIAE